MNIERRRLLLAGSAALIPRFGFGQGQSNPTPSKTLSDKVPSARPFRVGVIGHTGRGNYGHGLDTVWQRNERTQIVAVADAHEEGLAKAVGRLGLTDNHGFTDYRSMLTETTPDIVAVCPRHVDQHHDMIMAAINAGASGIYVEKPFLRTPSECDAVLSASRRSNTRIAIAHRNRYHPVMKLIRDMVAQGQIGRLLEIRSRGKGDRRGGGEDLWVLGSHVMNMLDYLAGKPVSCSADMLQNGKLVTPKDVRTGAEGLGPLAGNEVHARFLLDGGITAYFDSIANDQTEGHGFGLQLIGSEAIISMRTDRDPLAHLIPGNPFAPTDQPRPWIPITTGGVGIIEPNPKLIHEIFHHDTAVADLVAAIDEQRDPLCNAVEGALTVEMICSVFQSHRTRSIVNFPLRNREHAFRDW